MRSLEQLYEEIQNSEELKQELISSFKEGNIDVFLKDHDCDATPEDVMSYMNSLRSGAVSDDDLDNVAGGACSGGRSYDAYCYTGDIGC